MSHRCKNIFYASVYLHKTTGCWVQLPTNSIHSRLTRCQVQILANAVHLINNMSHRCRMFFMQVHCKQSQWNCSGNTAMHFGLQWTMACSETVQSAEVDDCKFCSDLNAKSFALIICRNCSKILYCQNCIELLQILRTIDCKVCI